MEKNLKSVMEGLSEQDEAVLEAMFDPLQVMSFDGNKFNSDDVKGDSNEMVDEKVFEMVKKAIETAESGKIDEALEIFDEARVRAPNCALILNDRAQALRLCGRNNEALDDLSEAIKITDGKGKVAGRAQCQRGLLHRLSGNEDLAKKDFEEAAKNGCSFARSQLVHLNPYAAMCNAMLKEIHSKSLSTFT